MSGRRFEAALRLLRIASTPAPVEEGDVWYRSDTDQVHASDGSGGDPITVGPAGNLPVIRPSAWHTLPPYGPSGSASVPDGRLFALPFWPGRYCTLTAVAVNVTVALVGGSIRLGLYSNNAGVPGDLVSDYGTANAAITGIRTISGLSTPVRPVLHWVVVARQGGLLNLGLSARDTWDPIVSEAAPVLAANVNAYYRDGVTGTLPAVFGPVAGTVQSPSVSLQLT